MLRSRGLTDKLLVLGVDGMDPRWAKRMVDEGKMPHLKELMERGACRDDLMLLGANPTITPPMWATLGTGAYPMTHGIIDYNVSAKDDKDITLGAFSSRFMTAEPLWNITAESGKKTLVMHWPGGSFPPTSDSPNLFTVDGSSPGATCAYSNVRDMDTIFVASTKAETPSCAFMSVVTSDVEGDEKLVPHVLTTLDGRPLCSRGKTPEAKERMKKYLQAYKEFIGVPGYTPDHSFVNDNIVFDEEKGIMWSTADFPTGCSISPVSEPEGWDIEVPEGAKEFIILTMHGRVTRNALILKNAEGVYDHVAIYKNKQAAEPVTVLENDVFTGVIDYIPTKDGGEEMIFRNMRLLKIAEDGSYVRIWASRGSSCEEDTVFFPKSLLKESIEAAGPLVPTSQMSGLDKDLIMKCNLPQWELSAEWQSKFMHYMIEKHGVEVIFSHFHNCDLQGHCYMKYMKNRDTSRYDESEVVKFAEATYKVTDDYIGSFMHLLDEGWTILLVSDHGLMCSEEESVAQGDNMGVSLEPLHKWGYTVLKRDEDGNEIPEIDWTKTRAIMTRCNSIYINVKGRDKHGIVEPEDQFALEEEIITKMYEYKHPKTGYHLFAYALHNRDAILLGMGGPNAADIIFNVSGLYAEDHGGGLSTSLGYNDTSLSPIFAAAGPGIKENFRTDMYIREVDVAPTAAALLGVRFPAQCEGAPAYSIFSEDL